MTTLNNISIPDFNGLNFSEVENFVGNHADKLHLHFLEDAGKYSRQLILSNNQDQNIEGEETTIYYCSCCGLVDNDISTDLNCIECDLDETDEDEEV